LKFGSAILPTTLLVLTASPVDHAAPRKPASREIARSAALDLMDSPLIPKHPKPTPGVERAHIRPLSLLASPPARAMDLAALCTGHISAIRAQSCTSGQSPQAPDTRVTQTNHYYLEEIGFDPQNCAQAARSHAHPRNPPLYPAPDSHLRAGQGLRFFRRTQGALLPRRPTQFACIRVYPRPNVFRDLRTVMHKPKTAALAAPPDNASKNSHLSEIGFLSQKRPLHIAASRKRLLRTLADHKRHGLPHGRANAKR
jgi:hypothetical protein